MSGAERIAGGDVGLVVFGVEVGAAEIGIVARAFLLPGENSGSVIKLEDSRKFIEPVEPADEKYCQLKDWSNY